MPARNGQNALTLDLAGPIDRMSLDLNGDSDYLDSNEMDDSRTFNKANELLTRDVDSDSTDDYTLSHDAVGNLTDDDQYNEYIYDVWGRLRKVNNQTPDPVSEYRYNGLNWRISMQHDDDADGDLDSADKTYYFIYDERWRPVATFREDDSDPKEQFVYHNAGADGRGTASYIDDVVLRDKDADTDWDVQADGTLEERLYYCQNWRHDVVALIDASGGGQQVEHVRYEAYGVPTLILAGDVDASGKVDTSDTSQIQTWIDTATYDVRGDVDLDGDVDSTDKTTVQNSTATQGGRGNLSHAEHANRKGYAGYEFDDTITHESYHVRRGLINSTLGQFMSQRPGQLANSYQPKLRIFIQDTFQDALVLDNQDDAPPTYSCPGGQGYQGNGSSPCDRCCTAACNANPGSGGVTACCGTDATACVCSSNVQNAMGQGNPALNCFYAQVDACNLAHEQIHADLIDCSDNSNGGLIHPATPPVSPGANGGLPWQNICDGVCSEEHAWDHTKTCVSNIDCSGCQAQGACEQLKAAYLRYADQRHKDFKTLCAACVCSDEGCKGCVSKPYRDPIQP